MIFIFGKRTARIAYFLDTESLCYPCKAYEREVAVYRSYFHICLIPVFPLGVNQFDIRCKHCGDETKSENLVRKYEKLVKTPLWLFTALFLTLIITGYWYYWDKSNRQHNMEYLANPQVGDIYTMEQEDRNGSSYYFLRIIGTAGDSVTALHNTLDYGNVVNHLAEDDFFVKEDSLRYAIKDLEKMLSNNEIYLVKRDKGQTGDFKKIK